MTEPDRRHAKFNLEFREEELQRFEGDSDAGPVVGFVYDASRDVRLVTLEHNLVLHPTEVENGQPVAIRLNGVVRLRYTPEEWVAFYLGARDGDFDNMYGNPHNLLRDSKDPTGPVFVITGENWRSFMDGVKSGKYDVPKRQEARILPKLAPPKPQP